MTNTLAASGLHSLAGNISVLNVLVFVPVVGALGVVVFGSSERIARAIGIAASLLTLVAAVLLVVAFDRHDAGYQFVSNHMWFKQFGISWKLGVDGISVFMVALSGLLFPVALLGQKIEKNNKSYMAWMLLLEAGCIGSFLALDLFLFFVFFEIVLVPMYFVIAGWGGRRRRYAALKFFLYTLAGSAFLLVGLLAIVYITSAHSGASPTFDLQKLQDAHALSASEARWIFLAFAVAFAVKVPVFPFHTWLADTYEEAPFAGAAMSAGVMVKLGTYGLVRFGVQLFPKAAHDLAPLLLTLGVAGMIYGAIVAAVQKDMRRLLAFSSLSHLGFIVMGTFAMSSQGLAGAVLQMINHGVTAAAMFILASFIYVRFATLKISELSGMQKAAPVFAGIFTVVVMSSIGVPGLNGFVGEFLILAGTFVTHRWWAVVGTATVVLASVYLLWAYQRVFHREPNERVASKGRDLTMSERMVMVPLIAVIIFLGVYPKPVLDRIEPTTDRILSGVPGYVADHSAAVSAGQGNSFEPSISRSAGGDR